MKFIQQQMKRTDCTYIGSSAGAMIAGTDIYLAEDFDENIVGLTDLKRYIKNSNQKDIGRYSELYSVDDNEALVAEDSKVKKVNFRKVKVKE